LTNFPTEGKTQTGNPHQTSDSMALVKGSVYLSFAEIAQGKDTDVRISPNGLLSAVDLVKVMTG